MIIHRTPIINHLLLCLSLLLMAIFPVWSQDYSKWVTLEVTSQVSASPTPTVSLSWPDRSADFTKYSLERKAPGTTTLRVSLLNTATGYVDATVSAGVAYEYKMTATPTTTANPTAYGTISAGVNLPASHSMGSVLLVVASDVLPSLTAELATLKSDLAGEGWNAMQISVAPADSVAMVKTAILAQKDLAPAGLPLKSLLLIGHVAVPYSGNINPDAHLEHRGAWPADGFYGDFETASWTDATANTAVNSTAPAYARNINVPGDGKFDQGTFPSAVELAVGRVDFHDLPAFTGKTHAQLLKAYFQKNHAYRTGATTIARKAVVDDNLATLREGPSGSLRRAATGILGRANVADADFLTHGTPSLFGAAIGYGQYSAIEGVGGATNFAVGTVNSVFNLTFGSYFGDWDTTNNALRSVIAGPGVALTSVWTSRPVCHMHGMGMGRTIGECVQAMMNQTSDSYLQLGFSSRAVSIALMGDPTLKINPVSPVRNVTGTVSNGIANLSWSPSLDTTASSYFVYRINAGEATPVLLTPTAIAATSFSDSGATSTTRYRVSAVKLETTGGTYWNRSSAVETGLTQVASSLSAIDAWKVAAFGLAALNTPAAADHADPDGDGCCNLLEYAAGTNPASAQSNGGLANMTVSGLAAARKLSADFRYCLASTDVTVAYQCSNDLKTWTATPAATAVTTTATHTTFRVSVPALGGKCFLRALVSRK